MKTWLARCNYCCTAFIFNSEEAQPMYSDGEGCLMTQVSNNEDDNGATLDCRICNTTSSIECVKEIV